MEKSTVHTTQTTVLAKRGCNGISQYSEATQSLINRKNWQVLIDAGNFEERKALLSVASTSEKFLKAETHRTLEDVFRKPTATLATVKKYNGEDYMRASMEVLVKNTCDLLNLGKALTDRQLDSLIGVIFSEYYYLTIADFKVCFRNGILGYYGKLFDRIDVMILMDWIETYNQDRSGYTVGMSESNKHAYNPEKVVAMPGEIAKKFKELERRLISDRIEQKIDSPSGKVKYASLADYFKLNKIEDRKQTLLEYWKGLYENADGEYFSIDDFLKAKAVDLLFRINDGKDIDENVKSIISKTQ